MSVITGESIVQAGRREERKAKNRAKLLAAARKVFLEKGLGEATARDIVRETDLATGTFYNYFRDKEEVYRALLTDFQDRITEATLPLRRDTSLAVEERITRGTLAFFEVVADDAELFKVLQRNVGAFAFLPTDGLFTEGMDQFMDDLDMWRREGDLPEIDLDYFSATIAGTAMQIAARMLERDPPDPAEAARFMSTAVMGLIQALSAQPSPAG